MGNADFADLAKDIVRTWYNRNIVTVGGKPLGADELYVVWICKVLQNNKALIATSREDGMYFEVTFNGAMYECYLDAYQKAANVVVEGDK